MSQPGMLAVTVSMEHSGLCRPPGVGWLRRGSQSAVKEYMVMAKEIPGDIGSDLRNKASAGYAR
jgi:hypothetical protein